MAFNKGDFVRVEYSLITENDRKIIDTTNEEVAKEQGIFNKDRVYSPALFVIGEETPLKTFIEALKKADVDKEIDVNIKASDAFGDYDAQKIQIVPTSEFKHQGITPVLGQTINFENGLQAKVKTLSSGRATLDFNHPLAGRDLIVKGKIVEKVVEDAKKVKDLAKKYLLSDVFAVDVESDKISIELSNKDLPYNHKALFSEILKRYFKQNKVVFTDTFKNKNVEQGAPKENTSAEKKE